MAITQNQQNVLLAILTNDYTAFNGGVIGVVLDECGKRIETLVPPQSVTPRTQQFSLNAVVSTSGSYLNTDGARLDVITTRGETKQLESSHQNH